MDNPLSDPFSTESFEKFQKDCDLNKCLDYIKVLHDAHRDQMHQKDNVIALIRTSINENPTSELQHRLLESDGKFAKLQSDFIDLQAKYSGQCSEIHTLTSQSYQLQKQLEEERVAGECLKKKTDEVAKIKREYKEFVCATVANRNCRVKFLLYLKQAMVGICNKLVIVIGKSKQCSAEEDVSERYEKQVLYDLEQMIDQIHKTSPRSPAV